MTSFRSTVAPLTGNLKSMHSSGASQTMAKSCAQTRTIVQLQRRQWLMHEPIRLLEVLMWRSGGLHTECAWRLSRETNMHATNAS
jgi:hypothetical protein